MLDRIRIYERRRRFWRLVEVRGREECWRWHGPVDSDGRVWYGRRRADSHAYELVRGPLPIGALLRHRCGDALCVNPDHMERLSAGD
jgi:hypothetical protein